MLNFRRELPPHDADSLAANAASALGWNVAGSGFRVIAGFAINIILARQLGPEPFGLVAMALIMIGLSNLIAEAGLGTGLVQRRELTEEEIRGVFTIQWAIGLALSLAIFLLAPAVGVAISNAQVLPVVRAMTLVLVLQALAQTSTALLKRSLAHKTIQRAFITSHLFGYLVLGLPLAFSGIGVWSLIVAHLTQALLFLAQVYAAVRHPLKPTFRVSGALVRLASSVAGSNLINWTIMNLDQTLVARFFGAATLGLYNRSLFAISTPISALTNAAQSVLMPTTAKLQLDLRAVQRLYLGAVYVAALVSLPVLLTAAAVPKTILVGLFGPRWLPAAPWVSPLALAMAASTLLAVAGSVLVGIGRPDLELRATFLTAALALLALWGAASISVAAIAWTVLLIRCMLFVLMTQSVLSALHLTWSRLLLSLLGPLALGGVSMVVVLIVDAAASGTTAPAELRLLADLLAGAAAVATAFAWKRDWLVGPDAGYMISRILALLPRRFLTALEPRGM